MHPGRTGATADGVDCGGRRKVIAAAVAEEHAPLLTHAPRAMVPGAPSRAELRALRGVLVVGVLNTVLDAALSHVYLPYARTVQTCDAPPSAAQAADVHAPGWSGSLGCGHREHVARDAQALINLAQGINLALCCVLLPSYGALADRIGRWRVIALYWGGVAAACAANALWPSPAVFLAARALGGALGDPHPIQHAQVADVCPPHARAGCFALLMVVKTAFGAAAGLGANVFIVARHLYDYTRVWVALALGAAAVVGLCHAFAETRPLPQPPPPEEEEEKPPKPPRTARHTSGAALPALAHADLGLAQAARVVSSPALRSVMAVSCLAVLGLCSLSTAPGWLLVVYGWPQERFGYVTLALLPAAGLALAAGPALQRRFGMASYLQGVMVTLFVAMACLSAAELGEPLFYGARTRSARHARAGRALTRRARRAPRSRDAAPVPHLLELARLHDRDDAGGASARARRKRARRAGARARARSRERAWAAAAPPPQVSADDQATTQGAVSATFHAVSALGLALYGGIFKWQGALGDALGVRIVSLPFWVGTAFVLLALGWGVYSGTWEKLSAAMAHPPPGAGRAAADELGALADAADEAARHSGAPPGGDGGGKEAAPPAREWRAAASKRPPSSEMM